MIEYWLYRVPITTVPKGDDGEEAVYPDEFADNSEEFYQIWQEVSVGFFFSYMDWSFEKVAVETIQAYIDSHIEWRECPIYGDDGITVIGTRMVSNQVNAQEIIEMCLANGY